MKRVLRRLTLSQETIRELRGAELKKVAGGASNIETYCANVGCDRTRLPDTFAEFGCGG